MDATDLLDGLAYFQRQLAHFTGEHSEAAPSGARARRLHGRIQCDQICLPHDLPDIAGDAGNRFDAPFQLQLVPRMGLFQQRVSIRMR